MDFYDSGGGFKKGEEKNSGGLRPSPDLCFLHPSSASLQTCPQFQGKVVITLNSVTYAQHAGTYKCNADYGDNGNAPSNTITLVVLG